MAILITSVDALTDVVFAPPEPKTDEEKKKGEKDFKFPGVITATFVFLNAALAFAGWWIWGSVDDNLNIKNSDLDTKWNELIARDASKKDPESWGHPGEAVDDGYYLKPVFEYK